MIAMRSLILLVPVLLIGCAYSPIPGGPSPTCGANFWVLELTGIDLERGVVKVKTGRDYDPPGGYGGESKDEEYFPRVRELKLLVETKQLIVGQTYHFSSSCGSPYLELYTSETQKKEGDKIKDWK